MPTVAAGTFALNCAYFGIPCVGNINVDTQRLCFVELSVESENIEHARRCIRNLLDIPDRLQHCTEKAKDNYNRYFSLKAWKKHMSEAMEVSIL